MFGLGAIGVISLLFMPLEQMVPGTVDLPRWVFLIQPLVLVGAFTAAGWWAAPRAGLGAPYLNALVEGQRPPGLGAMPWAAAAIALAGGGVLLTYGAVTQDVLASSPAADLPQPLATKLLYGGIAEELLARWGILSLVMVGLLKLKASRGAAFWSANLIAAILFGLGHFGLLFSIMPDPPVWLMAAVLVGNVLPALGFGWLFRRFGIEAAMLAHAGTHVVATLGMAFLPA